MNMNKRWDKEYMYIAHTMASMSKCAAKHVGCVIVKDNNIIASGVNGTPSGYHTNCNELFYKDRENDLWMTSNPNMALTNDAVEIEGTRWYRLDESLETHKQFQESTEIHAEVNAISKMAKLGISTSDTTLYCNYSPCVNCAKSIVASGIKRVVYTEDFDDLGQISYFLSENNVELTKLDI